MMKQLIYSLAFCAAVIVPSNAQQQPVYLKHEGTPTGEVKNIGGINVYHAYPPNKSTDNAILFLTDIFGLQLPQNRLLADSYAAAGYLVLLPDYFKGDPIPADTPKSFDRNAWRTRHPQAEISNIIDGTVGYARDTLKVKRLGAVGFCFGGPYVVRQLAKGKGVDVGFIAHPGAFTDAELGGITGPLAVAAAETDQSLAPARRHEVETLLAKNNATYQINLYSGVSHGFAIRVDMNNWRQVYGKEAAFNQALLWFNGWLKRTSSGFQSKKFVAEEKADQRVAHDFEYTMNA